MTAVRIEGGEAQQRLGARLGPLLPEGCIIYLEGDLGAGKTTLVRGMLRGLGYDGTVRSPTYTLLESYQTEKGLVHHLDLYRLADPEELEYLGIRDLCDGDSILLIEWPDKGEGVLPPPDLVISINHQGEARDLLFIALSVKGAAFVDLAIPI